MSDFIANFPVPAGDSVTDALTAAQADSPHDPYASYHGLLGAMLIHINQADRFADWLNLEGRSYGIAVNGGPALTPDERQHLLSVIAAHAHGLLAVVDAIREHVPTEEDYLQVRDQTDRPVADDLG
ncbi:hypothetical protein [Plantactinospora sp. B24E8]|uniref:hypothetical protein n=1 Tax=Plantactinospora sp. B24E8 TaxID=3153567 RepID=UPI00325EA259